MLTKNNIIQLKNRGISIAQFENQISIFKNGAPYIKLAGPAVIGHGILQLSEEDKNTFYNKYEEQKTLLNLLKFVPASGAATRMFKELFLFLETKTETDGVKLFFNHLSEFAFSEETLSNFKVQHPSIQKISSIEDKLLFSEFILKEKGMNYGVAPKGLIPFHKYKTACKTPVIEHIYEGIDYCLGKDNTVNIHFTVADQHQGKFEKHITSYLKKNHLENNYSFNFSYSVQKPKTDTIAVNNDNTPFIDKNDQMVFRPGGHGALIENLNDLEADIIFIKNVDNIKHQDYSNHSVFYKKVIAGKLLAIQEQIFNYLHLLENNNPDTELISEIGSFVNNQLQIKLDIAETTPNVLIEILNRPIRVCGMVKNQGAPGGGPFWVQNNLGTCSLQIVEKAQINVQDSEQQEILKNSTHFNPVDLVCGIKNYKGEKFDLTRYIDPNTVFISEKTKNGKPLKALELPGLWNGAMAHWITLFVEVPSDTFNPVKTVNDLLNPTHQPSF